VLAFGAASLALPAPAFGHPDFPGMIQGYVLKATNKLTCDVPCTLCHKALPATIANVRDKGFIVNLRAKPTPITASDPSSLVFALDAHWKRPCAEKIGSTDPCDTDGDKMTDMAELMAGRDPDGGRDFSCPKYGCGASSIAPPAERRELGVLSFLTALAALTVARRRPRRAADC
jgi:hypothetical protein